MQTARAYGSQSKCNRQKTREAWGWELCEEAWGVEGRVGTG